MIKDTETRLDLVAYLRVSTENQADNGHGLDRQRDNITAWIDQAGHRIVRWFEDRGESGDLPAVDRPGLTDTLNAVKTGDADGLVVDELDRLSRKLHEQEAVLAQVWDADGCAFTAHGEVPQDDPDDPMRTAMRQMRGVFHQLDKAMLLKRLRDGRKAKDARGGYAYGRPSYGWRAEDHELVEVDDEQRVIRRMKRLRRRGSTYADIADRLHADAVPTKQRPTAKRPDPRWTAATVQRILGRRRPNRRLAA